MNLLFRLCAKKISSALFWSLISILPSAVALIPPPDDDLITSSESLHFYIHLGESLSSLLSLHIDFIVETIKATGDYENLKVCSSTILLTFIIISFI